MGKNVHVVPRDERRALRKEGNTRDTARFPTQKEAIEAGRQVAQVEKSEMIIHGKDGKIRDKDSFGKDPFPPRDRKH